MRIHSAFNSDFSEKNARFVYLGGGAPEVFDVEKQQTAVEALKAIEYNDVGNVAQNIMEASPDKYTRMFKRPDFFRRHFLAIAFARGKLESKYNPLNLAKEDFDTYKVATETRNERLAKKTKEVQAEINNYFREEYEAVKELRKVAPSGLEDNPLTNPPSGYNTDIVDDADNLSMAIDMEPKLTDNYFSKPSNGTSLQDHVAKFTAERQYVRHAKDVVSANEIVDKAQANIELLDEAIKTATPARKNELKRVKKDTLALKKWAEGMAKYIQVSYMALKIRQAEAAVKEKKLTALLSYELPPVERPDSNANEETNMKYKLDKEAYEKAEKMVDLYDYLARLKSGNTTIQDEALGGSKVTNIEVGLQKYEYILDKLYEKKILSEYESPDWERAKIIIAILFNSSQAEIGARIEAFAKNRKELFKGTDLTEEEKTKYKFIYQVANDSSFKTTVDALPRHEQFTSEDFKDLETAVTDFETDIKKSTAIQDNAKKVKEALKNVYEAKKKYLETPETNKDAKKVAKEQYNSLKDRTIEWIINNVGGSPINLIQETIDTYNQGHPQVKVRLTYDPKKQFKEAINLIDEADLPVALGSVNNYLNRFNIVPVLSINPENRLYLHLSNGENGLSRGYERLAALMHNGSTESVLAIEYAATILQKQLNNPKTAGEQIAEWAGIDLSSSEGAEIVRQANLALEVDNAMRIAEKSAIDQMEELEGIDRNGLFEFYIKKGYATSKTHNAALWMEDLAKHHKENRKGDPVIVEVLQQILTSPNKIWLLNALRDPTNKDFEKARKIASAITEEILKKTEIYKKLNLSNAELKRNLSGKESLTEKTSNFVRETFGKIFDPSASAAERIAYGAIAYMLIFKGFFGKGKTGSAARFALGALALGFAYEGYTNKNLLASMGMDTPGAAAKGTYKRALGESLGYKERDKARYEVIDQLGDQKMVDIIAFYRNSFSASDSVTKGVDLAKMLRTNNIKINLGKIDSDRGKAAQLVLKVIEDFFVETAKKEGESGHRLTLAQKGMQIIEKFHTIEGLKGYFAELEKKGEGLTSPAAIDEMNKGHELTFHEVVAVRMPAEEVRRAREKSVGAVALVKLLAESIEAGFNGLAPFLVRGKELAKETANDVYMRILHQWGPEGWDTIKKAGERGWKFAVETLEDTKDGIVAWYGDNEVTIKKTGDNLWHITKTSLGIPVTALGWGLSEGSKYLSAKLTDVETAIRKWEYNETIDDNIDIFEDTLGSNGKIEFSRYEKLALYANTSGYDTFGKYEDVFIQSMLNLNEDGQKKPNQKGYKKELDQSIRWNPPNSTNVDTKSLKGLVDQFVYYKDENHQVRYTPPTAPAENFRSKESVINAIGFYEIDSSKPVASIKDQRKKAFENGIKVIKNYIINNANKFPSYFVQAATASKQKFNEVIGQFIESYGAYKTKTGYMIFLRLPTPSTTSSGDMEYDKRRNNEWTYGDIKEYKKIFVFDYLNTKNYKPLGSNKNPKPSQMEIRRQLLIFHDKNSAGDKRSKQMERFLFLYAHSLNGLKAEDFKRYDIPGELIKEKLIEQQESYLSLKHPYVRSEKGMEDLVKKLSKNNTETKSAKTALNKAYLKINNHVLNTASGKLRNLLNEANTGYLHKGYRLFLAAMLWHWQNDKTGLVNAIGVDFTGKKLTQVINISADKFIQELKFTPTFITSLASYSGDKLKRLANGITGFTNAAIHKLGLNFNIPKIP